MSRGTTLTLYKKYNLKMDDKTYDSIVMKYANKNKSFDHSEEKKPLEYYKSDLPKIMTIDAFREYSEYDKKTDTWVEIKPENNLKNLYKKVIGHVDRDDRYYCSELMNWTFGSTFDCLVEHFGIARNTYKDCVVEITPNMARKMLEAINYLLGGNWNDALARGMNNPYINIFAEGGMCDSYWKYVYRNKNNQSKKTFKIKEDGYDITIKCPVDRKTKHDDDFYRESDLRDSNEAIENALDTFRSGLIAFLKSDNWERYSEEDENNKENWIGYNRDYKYVLTYEWWG